MKHQYVICINNEGYDASLELRKLYEVIPDSEAENHKQIRILDESGEDYLYPKDFFMEIDIPHTLEKMISHATS